MKASAKIVLSFPRRGRLRIILGALQPEVAGPVSVRSRVGLACEKSRLILRVEAEDTVALRATVNAYLRWTSSLIDVLDVLDRRP